MDWRGVLLGRAAAGERMSRKDAAMQQCQLFGLGAQLYRIPTEALSTSIRQILAEILRATQRHFQAICHEDDGRLQEVIDGLNISLQKLRGLLASRPPRRDGQHGKGRHQRRTNAKLLTASPVLLKACRAVVNNWEQGNLAAAARLCAEAIKKAT